MTTYTSPQDGTTLDTWVNSNNPTTNYSAFATTYIGWSDDNYYRVALIKPDFSEIPAGAIVTSAKLYLKLGSELSEYNHTLGVYRSKRDWVDTQATWNIYKTSNNWATGGARSTTDKEADTIGTYALSASEAIGWKEISLDTDSIQEMIDGVFSNNGFVLDFTDYAARASLYIFYSSKDATPANRPYFVIEYVLGGQFIMWSND